MFIERFWPWSEIARLKSDVAGYVESLKRTHADAEYWSSKAAARQVQIDRQSTTLREKNEEIDALQIRDAERVREINRLNIELAKAGNEKSELRAQIAKFDGDGDGQIGGSRPGKSPPAGGSKKRGG